jgi:hypothetical protein
MHILFNKVVITGYVLGLMTILLAIYLITHPYVSHLYYSGSINGTLIVNTNPNDYLILLLYNTNCKRASFNVTVIERVPETNVTVPQYYTINLGPNENRTMNFMLVSKLYVEGNGSVILTGIRRPLINYLLTLLLIIMFVFTIALLFIGYLKSIKNILGKA